MLFCEQCPPASIIQRCGACGSEAPSAAPARSVWPLVLLPMRLKNPEGRPRRLERHAALDVLRRDRARLLAVLPPRADRVGQHVRRRRVQLSAPAAIVSEAQTEASSLPNTELLLLQPAHSQTSLVEPTRNPSTRRLLCHMWSRHAPRSRSHQPSRRTVTQNVSVDA